MKKFIAIISAVLTFFSFNTNAQDFYGAGLTGRHTIGASVKYDGDFWVGVNYNLRNFAGPFTRPLDFNLQTAVKIDKGIDNIAAEFGLSQVYANGNDFNAGFGLGTRLGFKYEYCSIQNLEEDKICCSSVSANISLKPGYYGGSTAFTANFETDYLKFYLGCANSGYTKEETIGGDKFDLRVFESLDVGLHLDATNGAKRRRGLHYTADVNHALYFGMKQDKYWNTWNVKGDYGNYGDESTEVEELEAGESNEGSCLMPKNNWSARTSLSMRF